MKIEHSALYVKDLEQAREFFEKYFDARAGELYHNPRTSFKSYFLSFPEGARLEIMTRDDLEEVSKPLARSGFAHICFSLGSMEAVNAMTKRFADDGYEVISGPRTTGDGYYESCILDAEGNQIEITV